MHALPRDSDIDGNRAGQQSQATEPGSRTGQQSRAAEPGHHLGLAELLLLHQSCTLRTLLFSGCHTGAHHLDLLYHLCRIPMTVTFVMMV